MSNIKLAKLEPRFYRYEDREEMITTVLGYKTPWTAEDQKKWEEAGRPTESKMGSRCYKIPVDNLSAAQCIGFLCPKCLLENMADIPAGCEDIEAAGIGVHSCEVTFEGRGVLDHQGTHNRTGAPVRWQVSGNNFEDLTTYPSILLLSGCGWHGFITNGEVSII